MKRETIEKMGLTWPEPVEGRRVSKCIEFERQIPRSVVHLLPPAHPSREVATDFYLDDDGEEHACGWRTLDDEEWSRELAAYESRLQHWKKSGGVAIVRDGPETIRATFILEDGGQAKGVWTGRGWYWTEWSTP